MRKRIWRSSVASSDALVHHSLGDVQEAYGVGLVAALAAYGDGVVPLLQADEDAAVVELDPGRTGVDVIVAVLLDDLADVGDEIVLVDLRPHGIADPVEGLHVLHIVAELHLSVDLRQLGRRMDTVGHERGVGEDEVPLRIHDHVGTVGDTCIDR